MYTFRENRDALNSSTLERSAGLSNYCLQCFLNPNDAELLTFPIL